MTIKIKNVNTTAFMKTVSMICAKSPVRTLISQLLEAAFTPCKTKKTKNREKKTKKLKIDEWSEKSDRRAFLSIFISSTLAGRQFFDTSVFINREIFQV